MSRINKRHKVLFHDFLMISVGICIALIFVETGILDIILGSLRDYYILASFVAGLFFTSAFTIAPSSIALVRIAEYAPVNWVALWAAMGAVCGDLILFFFIRDKFVEDIKRAIKPKTMKYIIHSFHFGFLKWISPIIGALIIASPLPDEFGITLLGMSKVRVSVLIPISFVMNLIGIHLLIVFGHLL